MNFASILKSKKHNEYYLNRYIQLMKRYTIKNYSIGEMHHICPKAKDMFPEYASLSNNSWNCVILPLKVHFYSHFLLSKAFEDSYSQNMAFCLMGGRLKHKNILFLMNEYNLGVQKRSKIFRKMKRGMVSAKNIHSGEYLCVSQLEFNENDELAGIMKGRNLGDSNGAKQIKARKKISKAKTGRVNVLLNCGKNIQIYCKDFNSDIHKMQTGFSDRNNIIIKTKDGIRHSVNKNDKILETNDYISNNAKYIIEIKIDGSPTFTINNSVYCNKICELENIKLPPAKRMTEEFKKSKCGRVYYRRISSDKFF